MRRSKNYSTAARLFGYLHHQKALLTVVVISIILYVGLSIWNPMYSAIVIDHLWESLQAARESGSAFAITWDHMGRELFQLTCQYFFTWIFYYLQSYLMANVAETLVCTLRHEKTGGGKAEPSAASVFRPEQGRRDLKPCYQ